MFLWSNLWGIMKFTALFCFFFFFGGGGLVTNAYSLRDSSNRPWWFSSCYIAKIWCPLHLYIYTYILPRTVFFPMRGLPEPELIPESLVWGNRENAFSPLKRTLVCRKEHFPGMQISNLSYIQVPIQILLGEQRQLVWRNLPRVSAAPAENRTRPFSIANQACDHYTMQSR